MSYEDDEDEEYEDDSIEEGDEILDKYFDDYSLCRLNEDEDEDEDGKNNYDEYFDLLENSFNSYELMIHKTINNKNRKTIIDIKPWNVDSLSGNDLITENFILYYYNLQWNFFKLARKDNLTKNIILRFQNTFLKYFFSSILKSPCVTINFLTEKLTIKITKNILLELSSNPSLTEEDIVKYGKYFDMNDLSSNPCITGNMFKKFSDLNWVMKQVSKNPSIVSQKILESTKGKKWDLVYLYKNPSFDPYIIDLNPKFKFKTSDRNINSIMSSLSENKLLTINFITDHMDWDWDIKKLSGNRCITPQFIKNNLNWKWDWIQISQKDNLTEEFINDFKDNLDFVLLSENPCVTFKMITENENLPFDMKIFIRKNPSFKIGEMKKLESAIDFRLLSENKALTPEFVLKNIEEKWNFSALSHNNMIVGITKKNIMKSFETFLQGSKDNFDSSISKYWNNSIFDIENVKNEIRDFLI